MREAVSLEAFDLKAAAMARWVGMIRRWYQQLINYSPIEDQMNNNMGFWDGYVRNEGKRRREMMMRVRVVKHTERMKKPNFERGRKRIGENYLNFIFFW